MIYKSFLFAILLLLSGCSLKPPANQWEYNSSSSFESYTKNFLKGNDAVAQGDLKKAIKSAKQSADLDQLARVYLGVCGLKISIGENSSCPQYQKIEEFILSSQLQSYYKMLRGALTIQDIKDLPIQYQTFAEKSLGKNQQEVFQAIQNMEQITSKFIAASLIKEKLSKEQIHYLIDTASFYGYKKLVIFWLRQLVLLENDSLKKESIQRKIGILEN